MLDILRRENWTGSHKGRIMGTETITAFLCSFSNQDFIPRRQKEH
jgi:hypothetical protein